MAHEELAERALLFVARARGVGDEAAIFVEHDQRANARRQLLGARFPVGQRGAVVQLDRGKRLVVGGDDRLFDAIDLVLQQQHAGFGDRLLTEALDLASCLIRVVAEHACGGDQRRHEQRINEAQPQVLHAAEASAFPKCAK